MDPTHRRARLLVVDDEADIRRLVVDALRVEGYTADIATDGAAALEVLSAIRYDIVLTDLKMPRLDGLALLARIKELYPDTDVILFTGYATIRTSVEAMRSGAYDYIPKPFDPADLVHSVRRCLERRALLQERQRLSEVVALLELGRALTRDLNLGTVAQEVVGQVSRVFGAAWVTLLLQREADAPPQVMAEHIDPGLPPCQPGWQPCQQLLLRLESSPGQEVLFGGAEDLLGGLAPGGPEFGAMMAVPLRTTERDLGCLICARSSGPRFTAKDGQLLGVFAAQAVVALENALHYDELKELNLQTIVALVNAVDARDPYTRGHSERVGQCAADIARQLGWGPAEVERVRMAGLLHDIGKIGISDAILHKPGQLTDDEHESMKEHPAIGARIVRSIERLRDIVPMIYTHHERLDGSGYPLGLKREAIPLAGHIIALADAFEAMTSDRPYKPAMQPAEALRLLQSEAGVLWDPAVVDALVAHIHGRPRREPGPQETIEGAKA